MTTLMAPDVLIDNPGPNDVFVQAGDANVDASQLCMRVPANSLQPFQKGQTEWIAAYCANGSQAILIHVAEGA